MRNILALAKEAINGNEQASLEFNDLLEENDITRIESGNIYYMLLSDKNDLWDNFLEISNLKGLNKGGISVLQYNNQDEIKAYNKLLYNSLIFNHYSNVFIDTDKDNLIFNVYKHIIYNVLNIKYSNIKNLFYCEECSDTPIINTSGYITYSENITLNNWLLDNISNFSLLKEFVLYYTPSEESESYEFEEHVRFLLYVLQKKKGEINENLLY